MQNLAVSFAIADHSLNKTFGCSIRNIKQRDFHALIPSKIKCIAVETGSVISSGSTASLLKTDYVIFIKRMQIIAVSEFSIHLNFRGGVIDIDNEERINF